MTDRMSIIGRIGGLTTVERHGGRAMGQRASDGFKAKFLTHDYDWRKRVWVPAPTRGTDAEREEQARLRLARYYQRLRLHNQTKGEQRRRQRGRGTQERGS